MAPLVLGMGLARGPENPLPESSFLRRRKRRGRRMTAERDGLFERVHEGFAVGTGSEVPADFIADAAVEVVVQIGRQLSENIQTVSFPPWAGSRALGWFTACHHDPLVSIPDS